MKAFSLEWKSSSRSAKQRKYRANAPLHLKRRFLSSALSKDLKSRLGTNSMPIRQGDTVKILKGEFSGVSGKVSNVDVKKGIIYIEGVERVRKDGTKSFFPIRPSSLLITVAVLEDKKRSAIVSRKQAVQSVKTAGKK